MDKKITAYRIRKWLRPYPIKPTNGDWSFHILPLREVLGWKNPNRLTNIGRMSFKYIAKNRPSGINYHYTETLMRDWVPTAKGLVILAKDNVVYDGSHRLTALALAKEQGYEPKMSYVGVLLKNE